MSGLDNTFGAILIGVVVASVLYGFTCLQTWYYFIHYSWDAWYIKFLVIAVFISDTLHQALITHSIYTTLVTNFGVFSKLDIIVWSSFAEVFFNTFTTFFVQCFLVWRIYKLSNRSLLAGSAMVFVIAGFVLPTTFISTAMHYETYEQLTPLKSLSMSCNANAAAGDIYIAGVLYHLLQRARTGFRRSDTMISKLIVFSISTGLLTSVCALASLVSIALSPDAFIYQAFYYCTGRLYCNTLLATLNARKELRGESTDDSAGISLSLHGHGARRTQPTLSGKISKSMTTGGISIKVDTTREYVQDRPSSLTEVDYV